MGKNRFWIPKDKTIKFNENETETVGSGNREGTKETFILVSLTLGHVGVHWFQQLWPVIIPSLKATLGLSNVELGTLTAVKQFMGGPLNLPSGFLADQFQKHTSVILAFAFLGFGISHFLVARAPTLAWMIPCVALLGVGTALWHPAAIGTLSRRFPQRRGTALAVHGVGASVGDTIGPVVIGFLLLSLPWQRLLELQMIPAVLIAIALWVGLRPIFKDQNSTRSSIGSYLGDVKSLMGHRVVLAIIGVNILCGMARLTIITFLPIFIQDDLGYSAFGLGFYWGLLHVMGVVSQPVMGYLSDKFGRKAILLPSLIVFGLLYLALAIAESGLQLILVIAGLGLFFYALVNVTQATVMDVASHRVQASTMGITGIFTQLASLPAPVFAGFLVTRFGTEASFIYAGIVTLIAALLLAMIRVPKSN